jgi:Holliday junction resolvasome RuvABC endonuclease subunit
VILALDLAPRKTGWCAGKGQEVPTAGALLSEADSLGELGATLWSGLESLRRRFEPTHIIVEAPIKAPHDSLLTLRKLYGMGFLTETFAAVYSIPYTEADLRAVKRELTGSSQADKDQMVHMAEKCGVALPRYKAHGREDAADAFGVWLIGVRLHASRLDSERWDKLIHGRRGAML